MLYFLYSTLGIYGIWSAVFVFDPPTQSTIRYVKALLQVMYGQYIMRGGINWYEKLIQNISGVIFLYIMSEQLVH